MKGKLLTIGAAALIAVPVALPAATSSSAPAAPGKPAATTVTAYVSGDVNLQSLYTDALIPGFEKANPGIKIKLVFSLHNVNDATTLARIGQAVKQRKWPGFDLVHGPLVPTMAVYGLTHPVAKATVPSMSRIPKRKELLVPVKDAAIPVFSSSTVLAYDSAHVSSPPKTLEDLLGWIRANRGRFTYNSPNTGGSGYSFVQTVVDKTLPQNVLTQMLNGYVPDLESYWKPGLETLKSLTPFVYQGVYPNGNQAVLNLLGKGEIWMAPVWSDQILTAIKQGLMPSTIKLTQISRPALTGFVAYLGVPKTARNKPAVYKFIDYVLQPSSQAKISNVMGQYPIIDMKYMSKSVQERFADAPRSTRRWYQTQQANDLRLAWQRTVP